MSLSNLKHHSTPKYLCWEAIKHAKALSWGVSSRTQELSKATSNQHSPSSLTSVRGAVKNMISKGYSSKEERTNLLWAWHFQFGFGIRSSRREILPSKQAKGHWGVAQQSFLSTMWQTRHHFKGSRNIGFHSPWNMSQNKHLCFSLAFISNLWSKIWQQKKRRSYPKACT